MTTSGRIERDSRTAILHGLFALIAERGMDAVSFRNVAGRAGVSVGRIQHHFGSRDALLRAGCRAMCDAAREAYEATAAAEPGARLVEVVAHPLSSAAERAPGLRVWYAYVAECTRDPDIATLLADAKRGQEDEAARLLAQLGDDAPRSTARELIGLSDGLVIRVLIGDLDESEAMDLLRTHLP